jgi:uncharacterized protein YbcI
MPLTSGAMTDATDGDAAERPSELVALSNAVVRLYKEQLGRGPTKARVGYAAPDTLVVTLEETMVPAERTLVELGEGRRMAESRLMAMQGAEAEFRRAVEDITGRKVRSMVCGMDAEQDISTKVFYLEPEVPSA